MTTIDISSFPSTIKLAEIEGKIFLSDNLDDSRRLLSGFRAMTAPAQMKVTMVIVCVEGNLDVQINFRHHILRKNNIATIIKNSLFQFNAVSNDFKGMVIVIDSDFGNYSSDARLGMASLQYVMYDPVGYMPQENMEDAMLLYTMMKNKLQNKNFLFKTEVVKNMLDILRYNGYQAIIDMQKIVPKKSLRVIKRK